MVPLLVSHSAATLLQLRTQYSGKSAAQLLAQRHMQRDTMVSRIGFTLVTYVAREITLIKVI